MDSANEFSPTQESLSASDVERLLAEVAQQEKKPKLPADQPPTPPLRGVRSYDFRRPAFLSASEIRKLKLHHEEFIRGLAARLSIFLRLEFTLQLVQLETRSYQKFIESLATPTLLTIFKLEPLRGLCLLEIHPRLGLTIVDRLMGGPAKAATQRAELSEIETALLDQTVQLLLTEWCQHWSGQQKLQPALLGHESNGRFLQIAAPDTLMLVLTMEAHFGDCTEQIQLAFPCHALEPLVTQLRRELQAAAPELPLAAPAPLKWNHRFDEVQVRFSAEWNDIQLQARDLSQLKVGDVLQLDPQCAHRVRVRVAGVPKFTGRVGNWGANWAVELTEMMPNTPSE